MLKTVNVSLVLAKSLATHECLSNLSFDDCRYPTMNYSFVRGRMLQFMNGPRMLLAKQDMLEGRITKKDFMMETAMAMKMVKMATKCFDENSMFT